MIWLHLGTANGNKENFLCSFETRCKDMSMQQCLGNLSAMVQIVDVDYIEIKGKL